MGVLKNAKHAKLNFKERNKKVLTIICSSLAVAIAAGTAGVVFVSNELIKGDSGDKLSSNDNVPTKIVERATSASSNSEGASSVNKENSAEGSVNGADTKYTIKLAKSKVAVSTGDTYSVQLADGIDKSKYKLKWTSDNETVATVDENGVVTGISDGKATITCTSSEYNTNASLQVTVTTPVYPEGLELDNCSYTLTSIGELLKLNATLTPQDEVTETKLTWTSSDESVASVKDGVVKAVAEGTATIYCTTVNDMTVECEITVDKAVKAEDITLDYIAYDFDGPQTESVKLTATVFPENADNQQVIWHSTDENVACVDADGNVTVVGDGECDVICTTSDGTYLSDTCEITATNTMAVVTYQPGTSVYVPVNPVVADTVLEEALRYVGKIPYVWGGTDLSTGVDCSGFICAVYQRFGINLWGVRTDLYLAGTEVPSIEDAKAGDILCYPGHVAIYDGNGGRVHAYDTGYMVMRDTNIGGYYTIRRIIE